MEERIVWRERTVTSTVVGPTQIQTRTVVVPVPVTGPTGTVLYVPRIETVTTELRGEVKTFASQVLSEKASENLSLVPAPPPDWAVGIGGQMFPSYRIEASVERRLFGPLWVRGWVQQPIAVEPPAVGFGVRVEF